MQSAILIIFFFFQKVNQRVFKLRHFALEIKILSNIKWSMLFLNKIKPFFFYLLML